MDEQKEFLIMLKNGSELCVTASTLDFRKVPQFIVFNSDESFLVAINEVAAIIPVQALTIKESPTEDPNVDGGTF